MVPWNMVSVLYCTDCCATQLAAWLLDLQSYLFGTPDPPAPADGVGAAEGGMEGGAEEGGGGLAAAHQAMLQREGPTGYQSYSRPPAFPARVATLMATMVLSWLAVCFLICTKQ